MRLLRGLCSTSASPSASSSGGTYIAEAAAQPLLEPVPAADRVVRRAPPRLDRALRRRLLLVGAAERHPVAVRAQHRVQVVDAAQVVAQLRLADLARRAPADRAPRRATSCTPTPRRRLQLPGVVLRARAGGVSSSLLLSDASTKCGSSPSQPLRLRSRQLVGARAPSRSQPVCTISTRVCRRHVGAKRISHVGRVGAVLRAGASR